MEPVGHNFAFSGRNHWCRCLSCTLLGLAAYRNAHCGRAAEFLLASRSAVVLPNDGLDEARTWTLWRVLSPKTRGLGASQQPARIDDPPIAGLPTSAFGNMPAEQPLWPLSPSAFRCRFRVLGESPGLPETCSPASLRGSGATFLYDVTRNTDLVARRGRWMSQKTTNIYLQEVQVASVLPKLNVSEKHRNLGSPR